MGSTGRKIATGALLALVVGAPAAASWHGLTAAGREMLGLPGLWSALVPLTLDAAALFAAVLALRDVVQGDAAGANRALVWLYALGSAGMNAWHADRVGGLPAALFYAVASVSAVVLWDRLLRAMRRDQLRALGAVSAPTPRFRAARWVCAPRETAQAWRLAVLEGVSDPTEAVRLARVERNTPDGRRALAVSTPAAIASAGDVELVDQAGEEVDEVAAELRALSKADAVRRAFAGPAADQGPTAVAAWLRAAGVEVTPAYVSDVTRRDRTKSPAPIGTDPDLGRVQGLETPTTEAASLRLAS